MAKPFLDTAPKQGYREPYATLLSALAKQTAAWRGQLELPTPEQIVWQPYPNGHSIGGLLLHVAEVEADWIENVCCGIQLSAEERKLFMSAETDAFEGTWPVPPKEPIEYYFDLLDKVRARTLESVKSFGDPDMLVEAEWGNVTLRWVLAHLIWHESYHGGQAVLLKILSSRSG